jgi:DNA helicase-2/ATP-dependent DNA helicase PcrA
MRAYGVAGSEPVTAASDRTARRGEETAMFHADLHIHSKFSRACSRDCGIPHLAAGALRKGIGVVGTGDFTHPAWADELKNSLVPAEAGLLRLRPDLERDLHRRVPAACEQPVRFMLSVETSTIYRRGERTRKVHHLICAPTLEAADRITGSLAKVGNLASDGRPIRGLDSRDLLEITLQAGPGCYLVPAHIGHHGSLFLVHGPVSTRSPTATAILLREIFAVETGMSSDPRMNWMCSSLDGYQLVSNSDAHSPPMLGREATTFTTAMDFFSISEALRTGDGLAGTIEFYPEEGKYHLDGHRKCGIRLEPEQTRERDGSAPSVINHLPSGPAPGRGTR